MWSVLKLCTFPRWGQGAWVCSNCVCVCVYVFDSTILCTVCLKHDVPLLMSSDHMQHARLSDVSAVLSLSSLLSYTAPLWRSGCLGPSSLTNTVLLKEILNQRWTSKGRHTLAHIWGQNLSRLPSHCENGGRLMNNCCIIRRTCMQTCLMSEINGRAFSAVILLCLQLYQ